MERLSLSGKRWNVPSNVCTSIDDLIDQRLKTLGHGDRQWDDASSFPELTVAIERLQRAIDARGTIGIFGDYDCDGVTATAQMVRLCRRHGIEPIVRLPHRVDDGYGLKSGHIDEFAAKRVSLLITVDTGIGAKDAVSYGNTLGIDTIILDHHHCDGRPDAFAVLHPALAPNFQGVHPAAAGVVFLFVNAFEKGEWTDRSIDVSLAMFGTIADLVPLRGMNRLLAQEGLYALRTLPSGPLQDLVMRLGKGKPLTSMDIAFRIAPRINAAGRMASPVIALEALLQGGEQLQALESLNTARQELMQEWTAHALEQINEDNPPAFLAVADSNYQAGIIGLIAGKLTETFGRPSMAASITGDTCIASLRSPATYNIVEGLKRVSHLLTNFGGHSQAAGCSFQLDRFNELADALNEDVHAHVPAHALLPTVHIDAVLDMQDASLEAVHAMASLEPFGQENPEPTFMIRGAMLENMRRVGSEATHLQAMIGKAKVIGFNRGHWQSAITGPMDIVCRLGIDRWNNEERVQCVLQDMRKANIECRV